MRRFLFLAVLLVGSSLWAQSKGLTWSGDLRYRFAKMREAEDDARSLQQLRARLGLRAPVDDQVQVQMRLATGTSAISTNQTMGDSDNPGMPRRSFGLDQAFIDWNPTASQEIWLGRTANPFYFPGKVQTIYDSDLSFEGAAYKWTDEFGVWVPFVNAGSFMVTEDYSSSDKQDVVDVGLVGAQVGAAVKTENFGTWTLHVGQHRYLNIQDKQIEKISAVNAKQKVDPYSYPFDRYRGNSVYTDDASAPMVSRKYFIQNKYVLTELGAEWKWNWEPFTSTVFYEQVSNIDVSSGGSAQEMGFAFSWGRSTLSFAQVMKQSDSVVGAFTDSDLNGGGTDNRGNRVSVAYQLGKNSSIVYSDYHAVRGVDTVSRPFFMTQLDFNVGF